VGVVIGIRPRSANGSLLIVVIGGYGSSNLKLGELAVGGGVISSDKGGGVIGSRNVPPRRGDIGADKGCTVVLVKDGEGGIDAGEIGIGEGIGKTGCSPVRDPLESNC